MLNVIIEIPGLKLVLMIMGIWAVIAIVVGVPYYLLIIKHVEDEQKADIEAHEMEAYHTKDKKVIRNVSKETVLDSNITGVLNTRKGFS